MLVWIQNPFDNLPAEGYRKQRYWLMAEAFLRAGHRVVYWTSDFSHARKGKREEGRAGREEGIEVRLIGVKLRAKREQIMLFCADTCEKRCEKRKI